jgi:hypothetical protein
MTTAKFADLILKLERAFKAYEKNPTKANFDRWNTLAREYNRELVERQNAKALAQGGKS